MRAPDDFAEYSLVRTTDDFLTVLAFQSHGIVCDKHVQGFFLRKPVCQTVLDPDGFSQVCSVMTPEDRRS